MTRRLMMAALVGVMGCAGDAAGPKVPTTLDDASKRFDAAITALNWAQRDLYALGGRDILVSVQIDSALAPNYFRLPRKPAP